MITRYEIKKGTKEEVLFLHLSYDFEFASELGSIREKQSLKARVHRYIKDRKIDFKGKYIVLVVGGIMTLAMVNKPVLASEISNKSYLPKIEINEVINTPRKTEIDISNQTMVTVYRSNGTLISLELEEYLIGVLWSTMPATFHIEALKAGAIIARTYALKQIESGKILTDTNTTQVYKDNNQLKNFWNSDYTKYFNKVEDGVRDTKGLVITYKGDLIDPLYHSISNGNTLDSNIPYLKRVTSPWCLNAPYYLRETSRHINDLNKILGVNISTTPLIIRDSNNRVRTINIDDNIYTGIELKNLLGLRSNDFDIVFNMDNFIFTTRGDGHGIGLSQYGANGMANSGYNFRNIINHYYTNVRIEKRA